MFEKFINNIDTGDLMFAIVVMVCFSVGVNGCNHFVNKIEQTKQIEAKYKCGDTHEEATEEKESEEN